MAASALLFAVVVVLLSKHGNAEVSYPGTDRGLKPQILEAYNRTHYFQLVNNSVGTVVFFHGCSRSSRNFFPYDPVLCPTCLGLPEHVSHSKQALARGYNVLAMEPNDKRILCWSSSAKARFGNDQPDVIETVSKFLVDHYLTDKPVYLWGASSGGTLALKLPGALRTAAKNASAGSFLFKVHGIIAEVSSPSDFASSEGGKLAVPDFPPTVFVRMERDCSLKDFQANVKFLKENGVPSAFTTSPVRRVTPTFFSDRFPPISTNQSQAVVDGLHQIGMLDLDGYLVADPHDEQKPYSMAFQWTKRLQALLPWLTPDSKTLSLLLRFSPIQQELNVAYAGHDAVSDYFTACLRWLESRGQADFASLVERYKVAGGKLAKLTAERQPGTLPGLPPSPSLAPQPAPSQELTPQPLATQEVAPEVLPS